jgi:hypothetical protein
MAESKIGILTFHKCINYGSYWQARCLAEGITARGYECEILDHHSNKINIAEWKCAYQPVLPTQVPVSDFPQYREKIENFFRVFKALPFSKSFSIDRSETMNDYDTIIVGSDEVWNLFHPWYGKQRIFYGEGLKAKHNISYAASFGNYPAEWGLEPTWGDKLKNFESISVRDENSYWLVKNAIGIEPQIVLDPCLQFPITNDDRVSRYWERPYIAVYGHNFSEAFISRVQQYARRKKLPLVSIGYRNDWADQQWITADPHDFAHFIERAEAVVTNFFHGCIFSIRNEKPFVCETSPYRTTKINDLMSRIEGSEHIMNEYTSAEVFNNCMEQPNYARMNQNLEALRKTSNEYLDQALGIKQRNVHGSLV